MDFLRDGEAEDWGLLATTVDGFPHGVDKFIGRRWIINAIDCGSPESVHWLLAQSVELSFWDAEGRTVCEACLERDWPEKYDLLRALIAAGANLDDRGMNGWTPLHLAAVRNDVEAVKLLIKAGADVNARTKIDYYSTPLEDAERYNAREAAVVLRALI
jgi:ankyrin repeat protein